MNTMMGNYRKRRVAIIGSGISGLASAWYLKQAGCEITVFEANHRPGGHTDTHQVSLAEGDVAVDSGFIVFNEENYPLFTDMLSALGVASQDSDMSFSAVNEATGFTYGADGWSRLFAQRRNLINPRFYGMLRDLMRFYREAPSDAEASDETLTLGSYLKGRGYGQYFIDNHIIPMSCALWSAPATTIQDFPFRYFVAFMQNHRMLQLNDRPQWKTVRGGSATYVDRLIQWLQSRQQDCLRLQCPVIAIRRLPEGVEVTSKTHGKERFDDVVLACHSPQALALLSDASRLEQEVLGAIEYQPNHVTLHTDPTLMPAVRGAWASWNARVSADAASQCSVTYWMNCLQNLPCETPLLVSLNSHTQIDAAHVIAERQYEHPIYTPRTLAAQQRYAEINGQGRTYFAGAYWGWGFHEDGMRSAQRAVAALLQTGVTANAA